MSQFICSCVDDIFKDYDFNNIPIKKISLKNHTNKENAWICIDKEVYSIRKDDIELLNIFKNFYGQNVKNYILTNNFFINIKNKIFILDKLRNRKIGFLID
jgi:hypothetical protein